jgi:thiol-disulfide isomerase/thioredoxin
MYRSFDFFATAMMCACLGCLLCLSAPAQNGSSKSKITDKTTAQVAAGPKVTRIDIEGLKKLLKPGEKPLMINFWATWCDPCREEFPDLVKIDAAYKGKIDFITISLDDLAEINRDVPKFLNENKAQMPAYLLKTPDEDAAISLVSAEWSGNLPLTIIFKPTGETAYLRKGKIHPEDVKAEIDKLIPSTKTSP